MEKVFYRTKLNICEEGEVPRTKDLYLGVRKVELPLNDIPLESGDSKRL